MSDATFRVGDVISMGAHPTVPTELVGKFWRVLSAEYPINLDGPYDDAAATVRYRPVPPTRRHGQIAK